MWTRTNLDVKYKDRLRVRNNTQTNPTIRPRATPGTRKVNSPPPDTPIALETVHHIVVAIVVVDVLALPHSHVLDRGHRRGSQSLRSGKISQ